MKDTMTIDGETFYTDYEIPKDDSARERIMEII